MNEVIKNIHSRRSVRDYDPKPVSKGVLQAIIDAGNAAPSGCNNQGWRFVVIQDKDVRKRLADLALPKYKKFMERASADLKELREEIDRQNTDPVYYSAPVIAFVIGSGMTADYDSPMVCQNMMLAAGSLGIGSCWVYIGSLVLDDAEVRKMLALKEGEKVYGPILFGYPKAGFPDTPPKKASEIKWV